MASTLINSLVVQSIALFPREFQDRVQKLLGEFNVDGKSYVIAFLLKALAFNKLEKALDIVDVAVNEHWQYQPKECRGSCNTDKDTEMVRHLYRQLGLVVPHSLRFF